jgi:hypothetical protein
MTASDFDRDRDVIFFADTREESIYTACIRRVVAAALLAVTLIVDSVGAPSR